MNLPIPAPPKTPSQKLKYAIVILVAAILLLNVFYFTIYSSVAQRVYFSAMKHLTNSVNTSLSNHIEEYFSDNVAEDSELADMIGQITIEITSGYGVVLKDMWEAFYTVTLSVDDSYDSKTEAEQYALITRLRDIAELAIDEIIADYHPKYEQLKSTSKQTEIMGSSYYYFADKVIFLELQTEQNTYKYYASLKSAYFKNGEEVSLANNTANESTSAGSTTSSDSSTASSKKSSSSSSSKKSSSSGSGSDPYDAGSYWDPEEFYDDNYYDFFDYYDAEEYWMDYN